MTHVLGVDLGGTKTAVGLVNGNGAVLTRRERPTPAHDGAVAVLAAVVELAREILSDAPPVTAVGIGAAGVIDTRDGTVLSATEALPGWTGTTVSASVAASLGLQVTVVNDVHAHALGEAWTGAAREAGSVLMIAAGTGIGGAMISEDTLWSGAHHAAGHVGHLPSPEATGLSCTCGRTGHLEAIAAGSALPDAYARAGGRGDALTGRDVAALAAGGDPRARAAVETAGRALGRAIGGLVNSFDPEIVVLGGGLAQNHPIWWRAVSDGFAHDVLPLLAACPLLPASLGDDAAIVGAARVALELEGVRG
ncbi:MAG: ROK family protein [Protaetiibacter sp.]